MHLKQILSWLVNLRHSNSPSFEDMNETDVILKTFCNMSAEQWYSLTLLMARHLNTEKVIYRVRLNFQKKNNMLLFHLKGMLFSSFVKTPECENFVDCAFFCNGWIDPEIVSVGQSQNLFDATVCLFEEHVSQREMLLFKKIFVHSTKLFS